MSRLCLVSALLATACGAAEPAAPTPPPAPSQVPAPPASPRPTPSLGEDASAVPPIRRDGTVYAESELMGTRVSVNVWVGPGQSAAEVGRAVQAAFDEIARIESIASEWQPDTELSLLNAAAASPMAQGMQVGVDLFEILRRAGEVSAATQGAFDVTFHGVGQLWSFRPGAVPPTPAQIRANLPLVDYRGVELDPQERRVRLARPGMKIGLGAIAKGYGVDAASRVLRERGFPHHIVEAGGDTYVSGSKGDKGWVVGVQAPDGPGTIGAIPTRDQAVVTSGDYQRYFDYQGRRFSHIIDPRTGWPVAKADSPRSVTLVARDATEADAYCTAVAVMGAKAGMAYVEAHPPLQAVIVAQDGSVLVSKGLQDRWVATPTSSPAQPR